MSNALIKGGNVSLSKAASDAGLDPNSLTRVKVGLGWDARGTSGDDFDLDASAAVIKDGRELKQKYFVFFNNLSSPNKEVVHSGDNLTGKGDGDDEAITLDLRALDAAGADKVIFLVTIYDGVARRQNFGDVDNAFIRIVDDATNTELSRYDLQEDAAGLTAMIFGELYVKDGAWKFRAVGNGYQEGLDGFVKQYGVDLSYFS